METELRRRSSVAHGTTTGLVLQLLRQDAERRRHLLHADDDQTKLPPKIDMVQAAINSAVGTYAGDDGSSDIMERYNFYVHGKRFLVWDVDACINDFAPNSLGCFPESNRFRQAMIWCITWKRFDQLILILIFANSIILALADYSKVDAENDLDMSQSYRNMAVNIADRIFTVLFSIECTMKIIAMGLIGARGSYLMDPWNWIDFIVVFFGKSIVIYVHFRILALIPGIPNVSAIRTFRVLRPLRSLNAIAGMKKLVTALFKSIPELLTVVAFLSFLFFLYGVIGVQMWSGVLHARCRITPAPVRLDENLTYDTLPAYQIRVLQDVELFPCTDEDNNQIPISSDNWTHNTSPWTISRMCYWPIATEETPQTCSLSNSQYRLCPTGQTCGSDYDPFGNFRFTHPDESIRRYVLQSATYNADMSWGFVNFDNIAYASLTIFQCITREGWSDIMYMLQDAGYGLTGVLYFVSFIIFGSFFMLNLTLAVIWENFSEASLLEAEERKLNASKRNRSSLRMLTFTNISPSSLSSGIPFVGTIVRHRLFNMVCTIFILLNTIILSLDQYPMDDKLDSNVEALNFALAIVFMLECVLKVIGLGWKSWIHDQYNLFDALVVLLSVIELTLSPPTFLTEEQSGTTKAASFSGLRSVRLFALFKLARSWPSLQKLLSTMVSTIKEVGNFSVLFLLFMYIYALIGMQTFANKFRFDEHGFPVDRNHAASYIPRSNFDSMLWSMVTVFQILTGENWNVVMFDGWRSLGWSAVLYFISLIVFGNFIVLNLFLAILLGNFEESSDDEKKDEREELRKKSRVAPMQPVRGTNRNRDKALVSDDSVNERSSRHISTNRSLRDSSPSSKMFNDQLPSHGSNMFRDETLANLASRSLYVFSVHNPVRKVMILIITHPQFDNISLVLIAISTVALVLDNPLNPPSGIFVTALSWVDWTLTIFFSVEVVVKIIALGFLLSDHAYLRSGWNIMDFVITALAAVSMAKGSSEFKFIKTLRTFRALRPLRMINRNPGLKLVVSSLIASIPQILNVIMVCLLMFIIFSILAVNNFKGKLYSCQGDVYDALTNEQQKLVTYPQLWSQLNSTEQNWFNTTMATSYQSLSISGDQLTSRAICELFGATWTNTIPQSFDNVIRGCQTFFEMTTTEGWVTIMLASVDATEIDMQPIPNYREGWTLFFIAFIMVGTFFVMQLFVGVVIENFNKMKEKLDGTYLLSSIQREWLVINDAMLNLRPARKMRVPQDRMKRLLFHISRSSALEMGVMGCIVLNTFMMALQYFGEEDLYRMTIEYSNYIFALVFFTEAAIKIVGLGHYYWKDNWNIFDFVILIGSIFGMIYTWMGGSAVGMSATTLRSFRVGRLFRLIQSAPSLRQLFNSLLMTLPSLVNIGGLLSLVFFIYAAMGVQLFAKVKFGELVTSTTNFQTIARAMVTLIRCATGEKWNDLMYELASQDDCVSDPDYDANMCGFNNSDGCIPLNGCGSPVAFVYLYSFTLLVTFILLNIFIAVILEGFANEKDRNNGILVPHHYENFVSAWSVFDPEATGFLEWHKLAYFLEQLEPPMGFNKSSKHTPKDMNDFIEILDVSIFKGNRVFFNDVARRIGKFVIDVLSDQPLETLPSSLNLEQRWRKLLASRKIRKQDQSLFRVNQFHAATVIHQSVNSLNFRDDLKQKVKIFCKRVPIPTASFSSKSPTTRSSFFLESTLSPSIRSVKTDDSRATSSVGDGSTFRKRSVLDWMYVLEKLRRSQQRASIRRMFQKRVLFNSDTLVAGIEFVMIGLSTLQLEISCRSPRWRENRACLQLNRCGTVLDEGSFGFVDILRVGIAVLALVRVWIRIWSRSKSTRRSQAHANSWFDRLMDLSWYLLEILCTIVLPYPSLESFTSRAHPEVLLLLSISIVVRTTCWRYLLYFPHPIRQKGMVTSASGSHKFKYKEFVLKKVFDDDPLKKIAVLCTTLVVISSFLLHAIETIVGECSLPSPLLTGDIDSAQIRCYTLSWEDSLRMAILSLLNIGFGDVIPYTRAGRLIVSMSAFAALWLKVMFLSTVIKKANFSRMEARVHAYLYRMDLFRKKKISAVMAVQASFRFSKSYKQSLVWHQQDESRFYFRPLSARLPNEVKKKLYISRFQSNLKNIIKYNIDGDPLNAFTKHIEIITATLATTFVEMTMLKKIMFRRRGTLNEKQQQVQQGLSNNTASTSTVHATKRIHVSGGDSSTNSAGNSISIEANDIGNAVQPVATPSTNAVTALPRPVNGELGRCLHAGRAGNVANTAWGENLLKTCEKTLALLKKIEQDAKSIA